ncbi:MAG TPA: radical SAM protein [Desulfobulbaceae bacterium]|nr:radical SAM protein [Desulfobulbaceae bacterium]
MDAPAKGCDCLLIFPPLAKPCEPPAGIALLAGAVRGAGRRCRVLDANIEAVSFLLADTYEAEDTWSRRALRHVAENMQTLRCRQGYDNFSRYQRAVADINRVVELAGKQHGVTLQLTNYQDATLSPLNSRDLLQAAQSPESNIFFPYFSIRLKDIIAKEQPYLVGFSLNFLSQALTTFAMIGFVKKHFPALQVVVGGGLITSWLRNPGWTNPFAGLIDHLIAGKGEGPLLALLGQKPPKKDYIPDFQDIADNPYLAPGLILPYAASSGCYWNRCSFCPETAEKNPYTALPPDQVTEELTRLCTDYNPDLIHFLDNGVSPALMSALADRPPGAPWYGFARADRQLADPAFCRRLKQSGCLMLKLGLESGDQSVLDAMDKGINLAQVAAVLAALHAAGIATYVYLLFGTPTESIDQARKTLDFTVNHCREITFLNLAVFNLPVCSPEAGYLATNHFYTGDLSLYCDFIHPKGWNRKKIRRFLDREFKKHPAIVPIIRRDPPLFTSNHAPFFRPGSSASFQ